MTSSLLDGHGLFQRRYFHEREYLRNLALADQRPSALFIGCSDSRVVPEYLTSAGFGELFVLRNIANFVPKLDHADASVGAAIDYALGALGVPDIIVCGHSHCGAMKAVLDPTQVADLPAVASWLGHADATRKIMKQNYGHLTGDALLTATVQENVLGQLDHLRTLPSVASSLSAGRLKLHAWVYKIETGEVFAFDRDEGQFLPLTSTRPSAMAPAGTRTI